MGRQRIWQVRRVSVPTATGQQRRDRAYQLLPQVDGDDLARAGGATGADPAGGVPCA
jgi:hypothetical protein